MQTRDISRAFEFVSRIEAGKEIPVDRQEQDIIEVIHQVAYHVQHMTTQHRLETKLPPAPATLSIDRQRIEQVLENLLSNALKYGGTPPHLQLGGEVDEGRARFWVRDNGQTLTEEDAKAIAVDVPGCHTIADAGRKVLTGPVALNDEEFATVAEGMGLALVLSAVLVLGLLFAALSGIGALYFCWLWTGGRRTLPMKTWRLRLARREDADIKSFDNLFSTGNYRAAIRRLRHLPAAVGSVLALEPHIIGWSETFARVENALFGPIGLLGAAVRATGPGPRGRARRRCCEGEAERRRHRSRLAGQRPAGDGHRHCAGTRSPRSGPGRRASSRRPPARCGRSPGPRESRGSPAWGRRPAAPFP